MRSMIKLLRENAKTSTMNSEKTGRPQEEMVTGCELGYRRNGNKKLEVEGTGKR